MKIRRATKDDWPAFAEMWKEFLTENLASGADMLPTDKTMKFYQDIFNSYDSGEVRGVALMADDAGVLLWGAPAAVLAFDTRNDPFAFGWGTYVRPDHRGKSLSTELRNTAKKILLDMEFRRLVGGTAVNNEQGIATVISLGFEPTAMQWVLELKGDA